jgi:co-chaperonin GroES (HSP10)
MSLAPEGDFAARPPAAVSDRQPEWAAAVALLGSRYLVELLKPAEKTEGGVWLPERCQENWTHATVLKAGVGERWPAEPDPDAQTTVPLWLVEGDEVLFPKHAFHSAGAPHTHGVVRDEDLVAAVVQGTLKPLNDWVMIDQDPDEPDPSPAIAYAEEYRPKATHGIARDYGPGRVQRKGALAGLRRPVAWAIGMLYQPWGAPPWQDVLIGKRVWWSHDCEVISMGRERLEALFVQAEDLLFIQED